MRSALADAARRSPGEVGVAAVEYDPVTGRSTQRYRIQLPDWSMGSAPSIGLRYFDVERGQLVTSQTHLPAVWRMPAPAAYLLAGLGVLSSLAVVLVLRGPYGRMLARRRLRAALRQAGDAHELRRLLQEAAHCTTLSEWAAARRSASARQLAAALNRACFANAGMDPLETLKRKAVEAI
jgi:hypothetical protein